MHIVIAAPVVAPGIPCVATSVNSEVVCGVTSGGFVARTLPR